MRGKGKERKGIEGREVGDEKKEEGKVWAGCLGRLWMGFRIGFFADGSSCEDILMW